MKHFAIPLSVILTGTLLCATAVAAPEPESEPTSTEDASVEAPARLGVDAAVGLYSAYVWRGLNIFQSDGQMDQHAMVAPSLTVSLPISGLSFGYWGAYQLNGDNRSALVDVGLGFEQDLILGYERTFSDQVSGAVALTYYFYPLADEDLAGTSVPSIIEPSASVAYAAGVVDVGLAIAYFHGLQDVLEGGRHLYLNPSVSHSFAVSDDLAVDANLGFGYKKFNDSSVEDNVYDVLVSVAMAYPVTAKLTVTPTLNAAWTNLRGQGFGDEYVVWAGVDLGVPVL